MTRTTTLSIVALLAAAAASGQSVPNPPAFEVAEIKPSPAKDIGPGKERLLPGGRIELPHATVKELMVGAYGIQSNMIFGGPKWLETDRFDIVAKASENTPIPTILLMLRTLLEERFKLVIHREDRAMPSFTLVVGKGGSKLRPTSSAGGRQNCSSRPAEGGIRAIHRECHNMAMPEFARQLGLPGFGIDRQVTDATGLGGAYDFEFDYAPASAGRGEPERGVDAPAAADLPPGPTIFQAMNQLGLRLEASKGPVSVIVIDSAEKPAGN